MIVQTAPAIRAALGEEFGYEPGTLVTGKMVAALRRLGFDAVFDTNFTADLTIMEEGTELLDRLKKALSTGETVALPMFTSCSPGWINYMEHYNPDMLANLSTCKSPQQMFGALAKTYYAEKLGMEPEDIVVVSVMPCTAKKFECARPEMNDSGVQDVDYVLTTRELGAHDQAGRHRLPQPARRADGRAAGHHHRRGRHLRRHRRRDGSGAAHGLRDRHRQPFPFPNLHVAPIEGLEGVKEATVTIEGARASGRSSRAPTLKVAVAHGLANAQKVIDRIRSGEADLPLRRGHDLPRRLHRRRRPAAPHLQRGARRRASDAIYARGRGPRAAQVPREPGGLRPLRGVPRGAAAARSSHQLLHTKYTEKDRV